MIVGPLVRYRRRPVALLEPGPGPRRLRVRADWTDRIYTTKRDTERALASLARAEAICYVPSRLLDLRTVTPATDWKLSLWRGRAVAMTHLPTGLRVRSLRGALGASRDPYRDLMTVLAWLAQRGVEAKSIPAMSWDLWRSTLSGSVRIGADYEPGRGALFGGRQAAEPGTYWRSIIWDVRSAYPAAMAALPVATGLREVSPGTTLDASTPGLAQASVFVPMDLPYAPLPVREAPDVVSYPLGPIAGTWTWRELHAAMMLGAEVRVERCWAPRRTEALFSPWWESVREGRELPGASGTMVKSIINSLWGQFALRGEGAIEVYWADDAGESPIERPLAPRALPHHYTVHVAAEISSRVRVQTLMEGIYESGRVQHVDTDGIITSRLGDGPVNQGDRPGQWRPKAFVHELEVLAPQIYRYTAESDPQRWRYVAAGMSEDGAFEIFRQSPGLRSRVPVLRMDEVTMPTYKATDREARYRLIMETKRR